MESCRRWSRPRGRGREPGSGAGFFSSPWIPSGAGESAAPACVRQLSGILARGIDGVRDVREVLRAKVRHGGGSAAGAAAAGLSAEILLWAMGLFCGFIGAFLLIAPHRFQSGSLRGPPALRARLGDARARLRVGAAGRGGAAPPALVELRRPLPGRGDAARARRELRPGGRRLGSGDLHHPRRGRRSSPACCPGPRRGPPPRAATCSRLLMGVVATVAGAADPRRCRELFQGAFYGPYRGYLTVFGAGASC